MIKGWYYHPNCYLKIQVIKCYGEFSGRYKVKAFYWNKNKTIKYEQLKEISTDNCLIKE